MKEIILGLFVFGLTTQAFAQETEILDLYITPASYKYIDKVTEDSTEVNTAEVNTAAPIKLFQQRAAIFNLENSKYYEDDYGYYFLSFYIPEGKMLASYDAEGNMLRSVEKLKHTETPPMVAKAIVQKYPGWIVSDNIYLVNYHDKAELKAKEYKLLLEKGNLRMRIRTDEKGGFIKPKVH